MNVLKMLLTFISLMSPGFVNSQIISDAWQEERIHGPSQIGIVDSIPLDLNDDGLMDVVSVSIEDGQVRSYLNQDNYEFVESIISDDVYGAFRISATDINGDGAFDFLLPLIETHEVVVLISEGGGYRKQVIANNILLPTDALAGDFNGDGLMDVVSVSFENDAVYLHQQNPGLVFKTIKLPASIDGPRKLIVADFDSNPGLDFMLASSEDDTVRLFMNRDGFIFEETIIDQQLPGVRFITHCDLNGDLMIDMVAAATESNQVWVYTNQGDGLFDRKILDDSLLGGSALHCVDYDSDDQEELVAVSGQLSHIYTYEFQAAFTKTLIASSSDGYVTVNSAVFKPNDPVKILSQTFFQNKNLLYDTEALNYEQAIWEQFPDGAYSVKAGDLNGDEKVDYVYTAFRENRIYWANQVSEGKFEIYLVSDLVEGPQSVHLADMDNDEDLDIVSAGAWDNTFWLHSNDGQGSFNTSPIFSGANNAARVTVFDVNEDGKNDVVGTSGLDDSVRWFEQTSNGFIPHLISSESDGALAIIHSDINQDGRADLIVGNYFGDSIDLFTNEGGGNFTKTTLSNSPVQPTSIAAADFDSDGDNDIVFNSKSQGAIWRVENNGGELKAEVLVIDQFTNAEDVIFIDINGNNSKDIVGVGVSDLGLTGFFENQAGQFGSHVLANAAFGFRSIQEVSAMAGELIKLVAASNINNMIVTFTIKDLIFTDSF